MRSIGFRTFRLDPDKGFFLNDRPLKLKGTCNHQDHAGVGVAVPDSIQYFRIRRLKEMGSNAYRTSHNMPEPELVQACNEMGMMVMAESFDEWKRAKVKNGYNRDFKEWIEKDIVNLVRRYRNDPSVVMWCMGNEVPDQGTGDGGKINRMITK